MPQRKMHASHAHRQAEYRRRCEDARRQQLQEKGLPALPAVPTMPGTPRWRQAIANATDLLTMVADEMEAYFDDRLDEWQESEKGETFRERLDALREARDMVAELNTA
jgi:hypothetical protein